MTTIIFRETATAPNSRRLFLSQKSQIDRIAQKEMTNTLQIRYTFIEDIEGLLGIADLN